MLTYLSKEKNEAIKQIEEFLNSDEVRQKSDDDKTLLVCVRSDVENSELSTYTDNTEKNSSDFDNNGESPDTENSESKDDSSSESGNDTSSKQEEAKQQQLQFFGDQINLSKNTNSSFGTSTSNTTPTADSSNSSDETNTDSVDDEDNSVTDESESIEEEATESESEINTPKRDVLKGLSITVSILTIPLLFFLVYKLLDFGQTIND